jgi:hypothetical protein
MGSLVEAAFVFKEVKYVISYYYKNLDTFLYEDFLKDDDILACVKT